MRPTRPTYFPRLLFLLLTLSSFATLSAQFNPCNFDAGVLTAEDGGRVVNICLDDMDEGPTNILRTGFIGGISQYFITTPGGFILEVPVGNPPFDLTAYGERTLAIWSVAYSGNLTGVAVGDNICNAGASACFDLSNAVVITRTTGDDCQMDCNANGGNLALAGGGTSTTICVDDSTEASIAVVLTGDVMGDNTSFLITTSEGIILSIPGGTGPFDLSGAGPGTCAIWFLAYGDDLQGLAVGNDADDFEGCFSLSNPVLVERLAGDDCPADLVATINGVNAMPHPVTSTGNGQLTATIQGNALTVSGSFADLTSDFDPTIAGGAHLHLGLAGQSGPIFVRLVSDLDGDLRGGTFPAASNTFDLTDEQADAVRARGAYVNIHTLDHPSGEIRGQLVPAGADSYARAYLLGVNEVPSIVTPAGGGVILERNGNEVTISGAFSGLTGTIATQIMGGAHVHTGVVGRNGPIIFPLVMDISDDMTSATFPAADNTFTLTDDQAAALDSNGLYVNVHSSTFGSGEIRGQLTELSTASFYADLSGHQERPAPVNTDGNGRTQINVTGNTMTVFGSVNDLSDDVLVSLRGGAHLHLGLAGQSGPIDFELSIDLDDAGNAGIWTPGANTFTLTDAQLQSVLDRNYYVNVHTPNVMSGEVRGQVMNLAKGYYGSNLEGVNAKPEAKMTTGTGFLMYELVGDRFTATGAFQDLVSDFAANIGGGSHIHAGDAANSGPIVFALNGDIAGDLRSGVYRAADNVFTLTDMGLQSLMNGNYYFNLHTVANPSGEIRGQVLRDDNSFPEATTIDTPEDGATVTLFSGSSDLQGGTFAASDDPDGDLVVYSVEFTTPPDFPLPMTTLFTIGTDTSVARTFDMIYDTLVSRGAIPGLTFEILYRLYASDGSVSALTPYRSVFFFLNPDGPCDVDGGMLTLADGSGEEITICAGDGVSDPFNVTLTDTSGTNFTYVITNSLGEILALPANQPFDLDGAGPGTCLLWALSSEDDLTGAEVGLNVNDLDGCFDLSNAITVIRNTGDDCDGGGGVCDVSGGTITTGDGDVEVTICAGDGIPDPFDVINNGSMGDSSTFVITDQALTILGLPATGPIDLEGAGGGTCLVWFLTYDATLTGLAVGNNVGDLMGCSSLSNPITVNRLTGDDCDDMGLCEADGGTITLEGDGGDELTICAGDSLSDAFNVIVSDTSAGNYTFIITGSDGEILGLPLSGPFDLDGAGPGVCQVWMLGFEDGLEGAMVGNNVSDLMGCFDLSNPITVTRLTGDDCGDGFGGGVVINEVAGSGLVEFTNVDGAPTDLRLLFVTTGTDMIPLSSFSLFCGEHIIKAGDFTVLDLSGIVFTAGGELALFNSAEATGSSLLSYVAWGGGDHVNQTMAIGQDLWSADYTIGAATADLSVQRARDADFPVYDLRVPTVCEVNQFVVSSGNPTAGEYLAAYPNPFTSDFTLEVSGLKAATTELQVMDVTGRLAFTQRLTIRNGLFNVPASHLPAGTYLVRLTNEGGVSTTRVVKR